jgi:DNA replication licensing factor MCM5
MIFIVRDEHNEARDKVSPSVRVYAHLVLTSFKAIAKHVMNIHMNRPNVNEENGDASGEIDLEKMKAYIAYAKK